ncbi:MAG: amidase [Patescibacteria group bacterium]
MSQNLNELNLIDAVEGLKKGDFTSFSLVEACYDAIDSYDTSLKAFLNLCKDSAFKEAKKADDLIASEGSSAFENKPLLGIPYASKDNFSTKGVETTASSNILKGYIPPYESTVTKRLNKAGAILLGKTNMDAFAHGSSTETSDFGSSYNPWDINYVPGGSSGGSAVATAADMCIFSIGSETAGSIRGPASWCGVTGLKPTYGRVSRYGVIAMASSTDSPGPITKTALDSAYVLQVIAGKDKYDATSSFLHVDPYVQKAESFTLKGKKIGLLNPYFVKEMRQDIKDLIMKSIDVLKNQGAEIIEINDLIDPKYSIAVYTIIQRSEVSSNLARFTGVRYGHSRDSFGHEAKKRMMLGAYALSAGYYDQYYAKAQKVRTMIVNDFDTALSNVDLLVAPTLHDVAQKTGTASSSPLFGELMDMLTEPSSIAGLTAISIPCGAVSSSSGSKLPVGLQFMGARFSESTVLGAAHQFQKVTSFHTDKPDLSKIKEGK